jgi:hypothetical protein
LSRLASNRDPPDLRLPSSWDYRHESLHLSFGAKPGHNFFPFFSFLPWSLCSPSWPETRHPPTSASESWDYRHVPPCPGLPFFFFKQFAKAGGPEFEVSLVCAADPVLKQSTKTPKGNSASFWLSPPAPPHSHAPCRSPISASCLHGLPSNGLTRVAFGDWLLSLSLTFSRPSPAGAWLRNSFLFIVEPHIGVAPAFCAAWTFVWS